MDQTLLEKYWNGETTLAEEADLFRQMEGSTDPEAAYFRLLTEARKQKSRLTVADIRRFNASQQPLQHTAVVRPLYRWLAQAAAALLFALSAIGLWQYTHRIATNDRLMADTYEDPYQAYQEMRQALAFMSTKLNSSQSEAFTQLRKAEEYADMFK